MVWGADHCAPLRMEYLSSSDSTQLRIAFPSCVSPRFTWELDGPVGFGMDSTLSVWPKSDTASAGRSKRDVFRIWEPITRYRKRRNQRRQAEARRQSGR